MLTLGKFSAWISTGGTALPEYGVKYSANGKEATCWIPSEENELFSIRWKESDVSLMDEYGQLQVVGYVTVDGTSCGGHFMSRSIGGVRTASKDSVNTSATTKRLLLFGKLQLTAPADDDQYLDRYVTEEFGTIKLSLWKVENLRRKFSSESPTVEAHIIHERAKKATLGHSVRFGGEIRCSEVNARISAKKVRRLGTFTFQYRPLEVLRANGITQAVHAPPSISHDVRYFGNKYSEKHTDSEIVQLSKKEVSQLKKHTRHSTKKIDRSKGIKRETGEAVCVPKHREIIDLT
ncbi:hypothetical protein C8J57DRAFT_1263733 [Mycena rebaudengoi]|nr:hypothetical protein C8J57DRAFT_1263733 [Mycena rebaudengoi]